MDIDVNRIQEGPRARTLSRTGALKENIRERDEVEFAFRAARHRGTVVALGRNSLQIEFRLSGRQVVRRVAYDSILRILS